VEDESIRRHLIDNVLQGYFRDTVNASELQADGEWITRRPASGEEPFDVQAWGIEHYGGAET
jgi:hypothetical protein